MSAVLIADKLRTSLLQAAIQGKLTKQSPEDGDARDLLKEIEAEKARLIEEKVIRKEKPLLPITEDEIPFEIPENWIWVRLGNLANYRKGPFGSALTKSMFVPKGNGAIKVYEQKNAIQKNDSLGDYYIKKDYYLDKMKGFTLNGGDIIVSCAGTIGESYILPDEIELGIINQALMRVRCYSHILKEFYLHIFDYAIRSPLAVENAKGSAIKNIPPFEILKNILVPLPPLAEQHRIVEAIETVLAKIDKLKTDEDKLYDIQKAFPNKLRASLLQSAIQGQLTEQLPEDGDARNLLKEIEAEKARLIEEKVLRKEKPLPPITEDEIPFEIPENWVWQKLSTISYTIASKSYQILARDIIDQGLYPVVSQSQNYIDGYANNKDKVFTNVPIIIFGDHTKVIKLVDFPFIVGADGTKLIKPLIINIRYLEVVLQYHRINMHDRGYSRHFQFIKDSLVPIPPLAEQQRIVDKLNGILGKINKLAEV